MARRKPFSGSNRLTACIRPTLPSEIDLGDRQAVAAIAHGDLGDETQMAGDELVRGVAVAVLAPALGQHVFFLRLQHREPPDFFEIAGKTAFGGDDRQSAVRAMLAPSIRLPPISGGRYAPPLPEPTAHRCCDREHRSQVQHTGLNGAKGRCAPRHTTVTAGDRRRTP